MHAPSTCRTANSTLDQNPYWSPHHLNAEPLHESLEVAAGSHRLVLVAFLPMPVKFAVAALFFTINEVVAPVIWNLTALVLRRSQHHRAPSEVWAVEVEEPSWRVTVGCTTNTCHFLDIKEIAACSLACVHSDWRSPSCMGILLEMFTNPLRRCVVLTIATLSVQKWASQCCCC